MKMYCAFAGETDQRETWSHWELTENWETHSSRYHSAYSEDEFYRDILERYLDQQNVGGILRFSSPVDSSGNMMIFETLCRWVLKTNEDEMVYDTGWKTEVDLLELLNQHFTVVYPDVGNPSLRFPNDDEIIVY